MNVSVATGEGATDIPLVYSLTGIDGAAPPLALRRGLDTALDACVVSDRFVFTDEQPELRFDPRPGGLNRFRHTPPPHTTTTTHTTTHTTHTHPHRRLFTHACVTRATQGHVNLGAEPHTGPVPRTRRRTLITPTKKKRAATRRFGAVRLSLLIICNINIDIIMIILLVFVGHRLKARDGFLWTNLPGIVVDNRMQ